MKKTFLHLLLLMGCACCFPSCVEDKAEDAAARLTVSKVSVEVIRTGTLSTGSKATLDVLANRGYAITSDADWLSVDKPTGKGRVSVVLDVKPNETEAIRVGHLAVVSGGLSETVTVTQTLAPDTDDGLEIDHVYLDDDLSWCEQFGGQDQVQFPDQGSTQAVRNHAAAKLKFTQMGYSEYNYGGNAFYMAKHYFKMGGRIAALHRDAGFGSLDAFLLVDLPHAPEAMLRRYMGREDAAAYVAHHLSAAGPVSPQDSPHR